MNRFRRIFNVNQVMLMMDDNEDENASERMGEHSQGKDKERNENVSVSVEGDLSDVHSEGSQSGASCDEENERPSAASEST